MPSHKLCTFFDLRKPAIRRHERSGFFYSLLSNRPPLKLLRVQG